MIRVEGRQLRAFLGAFSPEIARIALRLRTIVLEEAPGASEFIDDSDGVVAMSYGLTDQPADAFCQIAVHADRVELGFHRGAQLPPAEGLVEGEGRWSRHVAMTDLDDLRGPAVGPLLRAALKQAPRPEATGKRSA